MFYEVLYKPVVSQRLRQVGHRVREGTQVALITFGDQLLVNLSSSLRPVIRQHLEARLASVFPSPLVRLLTALWCARVCCADPASSGRSAPSCSAAFRYASRWRGSTLALVMRAATTLPVWERGCVHEASLLRIHTCTLSRT